MPTTIREDFNLGKRTKERTLVCYEYARGVCVLLLEVVTAGLTTVKSVCSTRGKRQSELCGTFYGL
jgi:hypothetical protein